MDLLLTHHTNLVSFLSENKDSWLSFLLFAFILT